MKVPWNLLPINQRFEMIVDEHYSLTMWRLKREGLLPSPGTPDPVSEQEQE